MIIKKDNNASKKENEDKLLKAYQKVGLDAAFSKAIVAGGNAKEIIDTWKAEWRGEHGAEHPAIKAVLEGNATPQEAKSLLEAAEHHRDLVEAVASGTHSMKWAHVVLSSGFKGDSDAVSALLDGADPSIIAHLLDINLSDEDAKKIGQKQFGKKASRNELVEFSKMTSSELKEECEHARIAKSGTMPVVVQRLKEYKRRLKDVVKGYTIGRYPKKIGKIKQGYSHGGQTQSTSYGIQYLVTQPNGIRLWYNEKDFDSIQSGTLIQGSPSKERNKTAAKYLKMKSTNYSLDGFKKLILDQSLRHGVINHEEYEDAIAGGNDFNKT